MKKRNLWIVGLTCSLMACSSVESSKEEKAISVQIVEVSNYNSKKFIQVSGNIEANETIRLGFLVAGKINNITTEEGEYISKGKLLASLESDSYELGLSIAKAQLNQMQDDYNRVNELHNRKSIAESEYIKVCNGLQAAKAQADLQEKQVKDTKLYAPISGTLLKRGVEKNEVIDKGLPLFVIADLSKVNVSVAIPESEIHQLSSGDSALVNVPALNKQYLGTINEIGALADGATRSYTVKVNVTNTDGLLQVGMMANIQLASKSSSNCLVLPIHCIAKSASNEYYVYIADNGKAFRKIVSIGKIQNNSIEILNGLSLGDKVISSRLSDLSNSSLITVNE